MSGAPATEAKHDDVNTGEAKTKLDALRANKENTQCADCDSATPQWAVSNFGVIICIKCSGVHRSLGTHVSFVRSLNMDVWLPAQVDQMRTNVQVNKELEYHVPELYPKPTFDSPAKERSAYITAKYKDKLFVQSEKHVAPKPPKWSTNKETAAQEAKNVGMVVYTGILEITLIKGTKLKNMDITSESDPFCEFSNGKQTAKSKHIDNCNNPDWKRERLQLSIESLNKPISLKVWDVDLSSNELMGSATIDISGLKAGKSETREISLDTQGTITVELSFISL